MREFRDKVAVITGAASGIGYSLAERCAKEGMKVVLADIDETALVQSEKQMKAAGANVIAVLTDVSRAIDVGKLAQKTLSAFGAVHLLFNNAGVGSPASIWASNLAEWEWVMGVNLWSVVHGVREFVPIMVEQDTECHIVNTASAAGLFSVYTGIYQVSKHGVVALSEALYHELAGIAPKVKVSVLCPLAVRTRIADTSVQNRPEGLGDDLAWASLSPEVVKRIEERLPLVENYLEERRKHIMGKGMPPEKVADIVFKAIGREKFYILTHPQLKPIVQMRMEDILLGRNPTDITIRKYLLVRFKNFLPIPRVRYSL